MHCRKFEKQIHSTENQISRQLIEREFFRAVHVHSGSEHTPLILENDMMNSKKNIIGFNFSFKTFLK